MNIRILKAVSMGAAFASAICAQGLSRQAVITGGGSPDRGKCTIEVVVDGATQVEIQRRQLVGRDQLDVLRLDGPGEKLLRQRGADVGERVLCAERPDHAARTAGSQSPDGVPCTALRVCR